MSNEYKKPPLGAEPATIHAEARIKDLADAISRNIRHGNFHYCKMWAEEIAIQMEIVQKFKTIEIIGLDKRGLRKGGEDNDG